MKILELKERIQKMPRLEQYQKDWLIEALDNLTFDEIKIIEPFGITTFTPPNITVDGNKLKVCIKNNVEKHYEPHNFVGTPITDQEFNEIMTIKDYKK